MGRVVASPGCRRGVVKGRRRRGRTRVAGRPLTIPWSSALVSHDCPGQPPCGWPTCRRWFCLGPEPVWVEPTHGNVTKSPKERSRRPLFSTSRFSVGSWLSGTDSSTKQLGCGPFQRWRPWASATRSTIGPPPGTWSTARPSTPSTVSDASYSSQPASDREEGRKSVVPSGDGPSDSLSQANPGQAADHRKPLLL